MRDCMKHGGPDGEGLYLDEDLPLAFGHRRLSLLDLSDNGLQPMADLDGVLQIVFNGEIYNFLELKAELKSFGHSFKTTCDTEVILKAYIQWGIDCFERFNGMFALAIFDKRTDQLILARDHAGIKPLYYSIQNDKLHFASEVRAFSAISPGWPENEQWKILLLTYGFLPEPVTTLQNVVPLKKGTCLIIDLPDLKVNAYTFAGYRVEYTIYSARDAAVAIKEQLTKAVERHLISDAPIGLFLSGGIDSSILTLLAHKVNPKNLHTLSIVFEDEKISEAHYQQLIINKTKAHHRSFLVKGKEFYESLPDIINAMDQPSTDGINSYFICKYAHQYGLKAVLSGLGADEIFGGYESFYRTSKVKYLNYLPAFVLNMAETLPGDKKKKLAFLRRKDVIGEYLLNRGLFTPNQAAELLNCSVKEVNRVTGNISIPATKGLDPRERIIAEEQHIYMQNQLLKDVDYMSMWHSIEVRVPFLDKELLNTVQSIHPSVKYKAKEKKFLLIKAFEDVLPEEIYHRKKQGFVFPFVEWMHKVQTSDQRDVKFIQLRDKLNSGKMQWSRYWAYLLVRGKEKIFYFASDPKKVLFLNLKAFSFTGGIEKFNRAFLKALSDLENEGKLVADAYSAYDTTADPKYFPQSRYRGFSGAKLQFLKTSITAAATYDTIILGHINLAVAGFCIKKLFPAKEIILITHGIEIWAKLSGIKDRLIRKADRVLAVSNFTRDRIIQIHGLSSTKISVFHNTIDPYFAYPNDFSKPAHLMKRYHLDANDPVILTLTRLAHSEKYKGYDKVISILPQLKDKFKGLVYILAGKPDEIENKRIRSLINNSGESETVVLTGFVKDEEVTDHFLLADAFIMPSRKEGFGIVFIEAMACGLPVIGGNKDGSVDALRQGELGMLIDPDSETEILDALESALLATANQTSFDKKRLLQQKVIEAFGFEAYKRRLEEVLAASSPCPSPCGEG